MATIAPETLTAAEHRLRETTDSMVRLLMEHTLTYPESELRRRFVGSEGAGHIGDDELRQLRQSAAVLGKATSTRLERELAWPGPWLLSVAQMPPAPDSAAVDAEQKTTLRDFPLIWSVVAAIDADVEALATRYKLPADDRTPVGYQPPKIFVSGAYLPQLTERLVKLFHEIADLRDQLEAANAQERRTNRERRWQQAG